MNGSDGPPSSRDRRRHERHTVLWSVDCEAAETFLYASIANISAMGIFVQTEAPLPVRTLMTLRFSPSPAVLISQPFVLSGRVQWINPVRPGGDNPNPGMGVSFIELTPEDRERLVSLVKTIAYLRSES